MNKSEALHAKGQDVFLDANRTATTSASLAAQQDAENMHADTPDHNGQLVPPAQQNPSMSGTHSATEMILHESEQWIIRDLSRAQSRASRATRLF